MVRSGERAGAQHRSGAASFNNTFYISSKEAKVITLYTEHGGHCRACCGTSETEYSAPVSRQPNGRSPSASSQLQK